MARRKATKRQLATRISLPIVAAILIAIIVIANYFLNLYSPILHRVLAGDGANTSSAEAKEALAEADGVVRNTAEESMVLLYNDDGDGEKYLPLKNISKINLFGWGATDNGFLLSGGGSGGATILDVDRDGKKRIKVDLTDAFKEANIAYNTKLLNAYSSQYDFDADYRKGGTTGSDVTESLYNPGASFYTAARMTQAREYSKDAVAVISRWGAENASQSELKSVGSFKNGTFLELTSAERAMFAALEIYGFDVTVVLNVCNNVELSFMEEYDCIKACIFAGIPGQSGASAIPKLINGTINPSGRLSDTLAYDYQTNDPTYVNAVKANSDIVYQEGIYFGYKWYETADVEGFFDKATNSHGKMYKGYSKGGGDRVNTGYDAVVQYPFGYGLSYTEFEWSADFSSFTGLTADGSYEIPVTVTNMGNVAGRDVVQLYGSAPYTNGGVEKAARVLLDFEKTPVLAPHGNAGDHCTVTLKFDAYDLASYDAYGKNSGTHKGYELDAGQYTISVMRNSHEEVASQSRYLNVAITYDTDPDTGAAVGNLFTGNNAYAGSPIDANHGDDFLSRKDHFANYPKARAGFSGTSKSGDQMVSINKAMYDSATVNAAGIQYGQGVGMFLVGQKKGEDEVVATTRAALSGEDDSVKLGFNTEVMTFMLGLWDDPDISAMFFNQITQQETKDLIGKGGFQTIELASIGKAFCKDKDGPAGFNSSVDDVLEAKSDQYTLFCSESLTGCCWSKDVAYSIGEAQGKIGNAAGIRGWYGPGVNLHRSVYNSRNYEYYSEDAVLSGKLAANTITGAKDNNLYCYLKHFAVSEAGENPKGLNTWLTEQTLREIYLRPFEIAVKDGGANAMMSAFNNVGGVCAGYNYAMLTSVLRNEWGFKGSVITDWYMPSNPYMANQNAGVLAGNDLWLNGSTQQSADINLSDATIAYAARQSVKGIVYTFIDTNITATDIKVTASPRSGLLIALWVILDVVLGLCIALCILFFVLSFVRKPKPKKGRKAAAAAALDQNVEPAIDEINAVEDSSAASPPTTTDEQPTTTDEQPTEQQTEEPVVETAVAEQQAAEQTPASKQRKSTPKKK
ncbi:MAG: glycoside hydrolase family 3 C-terminal domain-containing protein [Clostridiales bacterium]|nr:glycoside hydrolase family 3 C-terminal domain-containing protein [Clostridiales bacterium]